MRPVRTLALVILACLLPAAALASGGSAPLSFGVINQRSAVLTAQYWNPILRYVSQRSGVPLKIKLTKTDNEHAAMIKRGAFDFLYSNNNFIPENDTVGYKVFARPLADAIRGQIIVLAGSPIRSLAELQDKEVVFPSPVAFVGYHVPMDALLRADIRIKPHFAGNQEGAMAQLVSGRTAAAGVNSQIARDFALRHQVGYRVLWSSEEYLNIPISVHPSVPSSKVEAVRDALLGMAADAEGSRILAASAALVRKDPPYGFVAASDEEFDNARRFYRNSPVSKAVQ